MPPIISPKKTRKKPYHVVNKDGSFVGEYDTLDDAILECWIQLKQRVLEVKTNKIVYP